jgi:hypothetical protein
MIYELRAYFGGSQTGDGWYGVEYEIYSLRKLWTN